MPNDLKSGAVCERKGFLQMILIAFFCNIKIASEECPHKVSDC